MKDWDQLPRLFELVGRWESATAMVANKDKTALIPMGSLKRKNPRQEMLEDLGLNGASKEPYEIYLGVPVASDRSVYRSFLGHKYRKIKTKLASWTSMGCLTHKGRAMVADTLIYSRMRYWAQCMAIPDEIHDWLEEDVQGLIWNKTPVFDPDEDGTQIENKRFMLKDAQYRAKSMLGLGLMNWRAHVKAMQIKAILDYRNATRSDYKKILNEWIEPNWGSDDMLFYNRLRLPKDATYV